MVGLGFHREACVYWMPPGNFYDDRKKRAKASAGKPLGEYPDKRAYPCACPKLSEQGPGHSGNAGKECEGMAHRAGESADRRAGVSNLLRDLVFRENEKDEFLLGARPVLRAFDWRAHPLSLE